MQQQTGLKNKLIATFSAKNIAVTSILSAISFVLYMFVKFPLPFFPSFLEIQFSDMPALLGGFALGPVAGCVIIVIKCLLKMPFTRTACVGELADIIVGIAFVLPAALIYKKHKTKKGAVVGLLCGAASAVVFAMVANRFILIPFYAEAYGMDAIVGMVAALYEGVSVDTFYNFYLPLAVLPFNLLRCFVCGLITYFIYKPLSKVLHWEFKPAKEDTPRETLSGSEAETAALGKKLAETLTGGETVLLSGDLGAGKTQFAKGLAEGLGIADVVTSPTFALHNRYDGGRLTLNHFDFYRLTDEAEAEVLGLNELFSLPDAVAVVEWWQNVKGLLPQNCIRVTLSVLSENQRKIEIER